MHLEVGFGSFIVLRLIASNCCIWMIVHRSSHNLETGDMGYLRTLIKFTLIHVNVVRRSLRPSRRIFNLMAKSVIAGVC